jgi:hypothetical protein
MARKKDPNKVTDEQGQFRIAVTAEIIASAARQDSNHCMIADAVLASLPRGRAMRRSVDLQTIRWSDPVTARRYVFLTPPRAQNALVRFDQGLSVEPFEMRLKPTQIVQIGAPPARTDWKKTTRQPDPDRITRDAQPIVEGGHLPPIAVLSNHKGRVREFGMRQLKP